MTCARKRTTAPPPSSGTRAREILVVLVSANAYLQALAATARAESAQAQLQTAEALYRQAVDLKAGGLVAGIDVVRAEVQLATERQRVTAFNNAFEKSKLQLARIIGMPIGRGFTSAASCFPCPFQI